MPFAGSPEAWHAACALDALVRLFAHEVLDEATEARTSRLVLDDVAACCAAADAAGIDRGALPPLVLLAALGHAEPPLDGLAAYVDADRRGTLGPFIEWPDPQSLIEFVARARRAGAAHIHERPDDSTGTRAHDALTLAVDVARDLRVVVQQLPSKPWFYDVYFDGASTSLGISALTHALMKTRPPLATLTTAHVAIALWTMDNTEGGDEPVALFRAVRSMIANVFEHVSDIDVDFGARVLDYRHVSYAALAELPVEHIRRLALYRCALPDADVLAFLCSLRRTDLALTELAFYCVRTDSWAYAFGDEHGVVCRELVESDTSLRHIALDNSAVFSAHGIATFLPHQSSFLSSQVADWPAAGTVDHDYFVFVPSTQ